MKLDLKRLKEVHVFVLCSATEAYADDAAKISYKKSYVT